MQYLANQFRQRWRKAYLLALHERQKWTKPRRNVQKGDVVLLKEESIARNQWRTARVEETYPDKDGFVRRVKIAVSDQLLNERGQRTRPASVLERPVQKLIVMMRSEETEDN